MAKQHATGQVEAEERQHELRKDLEAKVKGMKELEARLEEESKAARAAREEADAQRTRAEGFAASLREVEEAQASKEGAYGSKGECLLQGPCRSGVSVETDEGGDRSKRRGFRD